MQNSGTTRNQFRNINSHSQSAKGGEASKRFTRTELEDAVRRHKPKDIAAMAASRKRELIGRREDRAIRSDNASFGSSDQLHSLDIGVKLCARRYNETKAFGDKLNDDLKSRCNELIELERESAALHEMLEGNNPEAREIIRLSAEIKGANDSLEKTLFYRHQLYHMLQRVHEDSVLTDGYVTETLALLDLAQKEKDTSQKMLAEIESGLLLASKELSETKRYVIIAEEDRNRELAIQQFEADNAGMMERWNRDRLNSNLLLQQHLIGSDMIEREKLQRLIKDREEQLQALNKSMESLITRLGELEESFSHVKQATGVNSLAEMVDKIIRHEENRKQLLKEKKDAEERLIAAKTAYSTDLVASNSMRINGCGDTELNRCVIDDIKCSIANEKSEGKIVKSLNERLECLLVGLRQGCIGLYNRLLPYHLDLLNEEVPKLGEIDSTNAVQAASDTLEMMNFTEKILTKMLLEIGGIRFVDIKLDTEKETGPESPRLNCRVKPMTHSFDDDIELFKTKYDGNTSPSDEVLSRHILKMNSTTAVLTHSKLNSTQQKRDCSTNRVNHAVDHQRNATIKSANISSANIPTYYGSVDDLKDKIQVFLTDTEFIN